jgi:hypothetical protein
MLKGAADWAVVPLDEGQGEGGRTPMRAMGRLAASARFASSPPRRGTGSAKLDTRLSRFGSGYLVPCLSGRDGRPHGARLRLAICRSGRS